MSVQSQFAEAFREHRDAFGVPITFGETEVVAVVAESAMGRELVAGGFQTEADFTARVLLSDLPAVPVIGSPVSYNGHAFKVARVAVQPGHLIGEFSLRPAKR